MTARLVEVGEPFKVDMESRRRKMTEEQKKLWKHRAWLVWENLGTPIWTVVVVPGAIVLGYRISAWAGGGELARDMSSFLGALLGVGSIPLFHECVRPGINEIVRRWDG